MPRERNARKWVKIDCGGILSGSLNYIFLEGSYEGMNINELASLACQQVWVKMIAFSDMCGGRAGYIEDNNHKGLPHLYIAKQLGCSLELFEIVLSVMKDDKAIEINGTGSIYLINFKYYQFSEYDRQKVYRQKDGEGKQTFEEYVEAIKKDYTDLDIDNELIKFKLWWAEGKKELKRPKSAFKNWLDNARRFKNGTHKENTGKPKEFTDPEQLRREARDSAGQ